MINRRYGIVHSLFLILTLSASLAAQSEVYKPGNGITLPVVVREVKPDYTDAAKAAGIQGTVTLKVVVRDDGTVGDVQVTGSLDPEFGLDAEAVKATKQWRFKPGTKEGKPVAVEVTIELTFKLK